ncbi:MAG: ABC transporter substrate-binding protein [Chloroflexi bacterium]|nr:ABC transporter substrate-binding protein [Chloroflexota bacterium]
MTQKNRKALLSIVVLLAVVLFSTALVTAQEQTEVGTPRATTLIVDQLDGRIDNPTQTNPYQAGTRFNQGLHQLAYSNMWEINTATGEQFPGLAAEMPEALNDDYTSFRITLRDGLRWSDGEPITTADMAFTIDMVLATPEFPYSGFLSQVVDSYEVVDDLTMILNTKRSEPRLGYTLGVHIWGDSFRLVPKHIWENEDPATFQNYPPVVSGPYTLADVDPNGNWFLYDKRADWEHTDVGQIFGEPGPEHVLFRFYGTEERRIIAGIQNQLDIFTDISPEAWDILRDANPNARAWHENFPWANFDDPCERGIVFSNSQEPWDNQNVRWAMALATDIKSVGLATFAGILRVSPLAVPPVQVIHDAFHKPMREWMTEFAFDDGYQPFDPNYAVDIAAILAEQGVEGLPDSEEALVDLFGVGWWKHDPGKATEMLQAEGFTLDNGAWHKPDGSPWQITINSPSNFEVQSQRLAFAVADNWRDFGIDAAVQQMDSGTFWSQYSRGEFDAGSYWPGCGALPDSWDLLDAFWHKRHIVPIGQPAPGNAMRYDSDALSGILDQIAPLPSDHPDTIPLLTEFEKQFVVERPWLPMFGTSKFVPVITTYWDGLPTADYFYEGPWWWWSLFKYHMPFIQPKSDG